MRTKVGIGYFTIPVLYVGVILSLFYLQYADRESFTDSVAGYSIRGSARSGAGNISELTVSGWGLSFQFSQDAPIALTAPDGGVRETPLRGYRRERDSFVLLFGNELSLRFTTLDQGDGVTIMPEIPEGGPGVVSIRIPAAPQSAEAEIRAGLPAVKLRRGSETYILSMPAGSRLDPEARYIELAAANPAGITIENTGSPDLDLFAYWYGRNDANVSETAYRTAVDSFLRSAYNGWKTGRYNASRGEWRLADGSFGFSEKALIAYLSEAFARGESAAALAEMTRAGTRHTAALLLGSSPFMGDLMRADARQLAADEATARRVRELSAKKDGALFADPEFISYVLERAPAALRAEFFRTAEQLDPEDLEIGAVLGLVRLALSGSGLTAGETKAVQRFTALIEERIVPSLTVSGDALYLGESARLIRPALSLEAGTLLLTAGEQTSNELYKSVGRHLVVSSLALTDRDGFLPAELTLSGTGEAGKSGLVAPEELYRLVGSSRFMPHRIPLEREFGTGAWIWTNTQMTIERRTDGFRLLFSFPVGQTHSLVIRGVKPFRELYLYNTKWRGTNLFQNYPYGYYYDQATETLYMKILNRVEREEVLILY